jgi:hypothetical protein
VEEAYGNHLNIFHDSGEFYALNRETNRPIQVTLGRLIGYSFRLLEKFWQIKDDTLGSKVILLDTELGNRNPSADFMPNVR